jgi:translocation and assembly module TamB
MDEPGAAPPPDTLRKKAQRSPRFARVAIWAGGLLATLLVGLVVAAVGLNTAPGHRLLANAVGTLRPASGLRVSIAAIDGSLYGRMTVEGLVLSDPKGAFLRVPRLRLDWRPVGLFSKHLQIEAVTADRALWLRRPELKASNKPPSLPNFAITLGSFRLGALVLEPAVTGDRRALSILGSAAFANGDARLDVQAQALPIDGHEGGDRLALKLDARPRANRLVIDGHLVAPRDGLLDRLAHLRAPLRLDLVGQGDWRAWTGRATADLDGQSLLDASLTGRSGLFTAAGRGDPAKLLTGFAARLTQPALAFNLSGRMTNRVIDGRLQASSDAFNVQAAGQVDLGQRRFHGLKIGARLLRPDLLAGKVRGKAIDLALTLSGPFAKPLIAYDLRAPSIGFDQLSIEDLHAQGKAQVDARRTLQLPLHATAARLDGLDQVAGGSVNHLRLDGDLRVSAQQIASDNLRLRSDRLDATVILALSPATGRYDAALKGRLNRYAIKGVGVVDLTTDAKLIPTGQGQGLFRVAGQVRAQSSRIDNATVRDILGGPAVATAKFSRTPDGSFGVADLRLKSPKFQILDGHGVIGAGGAISFTTKASSERYGPLSLDVSGTTQAPVARLRAPHPNVGVQLSEMLVEVRGGKSDYAVKTSGSSPYGRFAADLGVQTGARPLAIDVRRATLGGVDLTGRLQQTSAGPLAGELAVSGSGLSGAITLSALGKVQEAHANLRARHARLSVDPPLLIGAGAVEVTAILYPGAPEITGKGQISELRQGDLIIGKASVSGAYRGGTGNVSLSADGRTGVPFSLAARADLTPNLIRVDGHGSVGRTALRLAAPAQLVREAGTWRLAPATLASPQGRLVVSGEFGNVKVVQARLESVDLSIAQAYAPSLGIEGKASGSFDATFPASGTLPSAHANLQISNFTRSGLSTVSEPVDINLLGSLAPGGGDLAAVIRRRSSVVGRLQAKLGAIPAGPANLVKRLQAASLSGGVRYNGPAEVLWGLSGVSGQEISGPIAIGADFSGKLGEPKVSGVVKSQALTYQNSKFDTAIDDIMIDGRFVDTRLDLTKLTGRTPGGGTIAANGRADLSSAKGFPMDIRATLSRAQLAQSDGLDARVSGTLKITNGKDRPALIAGDLTVDQARYTIARQGQAEVLELRGVRRKGEPRVEVVSAAGRTAGPPSVWKLDIGVKADNEIFVTGMGLEAEWRSSLRVTGDANNPIIVGDVRLIRGTYSFAGRRLDLARGVIHLDGSNPPNPTLDLQATTTVQGVTATIDIAGSANTPQIAFSSTPALPADEVLSRLLFGSSITQISPLQAVQLASALNSLRGGGGGGLNALGKLRQASGLDRLRFMGADTATGRGPSVAAGKYLGNNVYIEVTTDTRGYTATQIEVALSKTLRLLSQVSALGGSNISLRYSRDY